MKEFPHNTLSNFLTFVHIKWQFPKNLFLFARHKKRIFSQKDLTAFLLKSGLLSFGKKNGIILKIYGSAS